MSVQFYMTSGLLMGALGGMVAALRVQFRGFQSIDDVPKSKARKEVGKRMSFFVMRILWGAVLGLVVSFWFMDDVLGGGFSRYKLIFVQALAGYFGSDLLEMITAKVRSLFGW
jgi:hypothetical protein